MAICTSALAFNSDLRYEKLESESQTFCSRMFNQISNSRPYQNECVSNTVFTINPLKKKEFKIHCAQRAIWGSHSCLTECAIILWCDGVCIGQLSQTFQRIVVLPSSGARLDTKAEGIPIFQNINNYNYLPIYTALTRPEDLICSATQQWERQLYLAVRSGQEQQTRQIIASWVQEHNNL